MARLKDRNRIATYIDALVFRKNQSRRYINDEVWETVKKVWNSWRVTDARINTTSNYVNL